MALPRVPFEIQWVRISKFVSLYKIMLFEEHYHKIFFTTVKLIARNGKQLQNLESDTSIHTLCFMDSKK